MINPERGDVSISLGGKEYTLRPSYESLVEIEQLLGCGIMQVIRRVRGQEWTIMELAFIVAAGMKAGGEQQAKADEVAKMLVKDGIVEFLEPVAQFLTNGVTGGAKPGEDQTAAS